MNQGTDEMNDAVKQLHDSLSALGKGGKLVNVKFFLGRDRNVTQEQLCNEGIKAVQQIASGTSRLIANIDKDTPKKPLKSFLA